MQEGQAMLPGAPKIYAAIAGVINDIGVVSKDKVNKQQGFKYRSVDDVYSVLNPALAKNKVFILPEILDEIREIGTSKSGGRVTSVILKMKYTVYAEDGSHVETVLKGEAMDTGDKAINKAMRSHISICASSSSAFRLRIWRIRMRRSMTWMGRRPRKRMLEKVRHQHPLQRSKNRQKLSRPKIKRAIRSRREVLRRKAKTGR